MPADTPPPMTGPEPETPRPPSASQIARDVASVFVNQPGDARQILELIVRQFQERLAAAVARAEQAEAEQESLIAVLDTIERQIEAHFAACGKTWRNSEVQFGDLARMLPAELERLRAEVSRWKDVAAFTEFGP